MRYAVWTVCAHPELVSESESALYAVGEAVRYFSDACPDSFPIILRLFALRADGMPDRRYSTVIFRVEHDLRVMCRERTRLGLYVRCAARFLGR